MLKNYFKTAYRSLSRNRSYTIINVSGLSIGFAAALLIFLVIQFETSFDNFHKKKNDIYRIVTEFPSHQGDSYNPGISLPAGSS
ncbi:MAG: ABC transporter permease, partial [Ginsengibacter sp.]